jgi:hypothetical protein
MLFNVPQFIDIEDKIVGPLTAKQLGWMAIAGILLLIIWSLFEAAVFILLSVAVCGIFGALAFYKPYNQPLSKFIFSGFHYFYKPKVYVWKRYYDSIGTVSRVSSNSRQKAEPAKKVLQADKIKEIAKMVDKK